MEHMKSIVMKILNIQNFERLHNWEIVDFVVFFDAQLG